MYFSPNELLQSMISTTQTTRRKSDESAMKQTTSKVFACLKRPILTLATTVILLSTIGQQVESSGVFELEFIKFDQLNAPRLLSEIIEPTSRTEPSHQHQYQLQEQASRSTKSLLKVFVCLKQAFASQLDGPCTFGNVTTTLVKEPSILPLQESQLSDNKQQQVSNRHQQLSGSLSANLVRIPFTFRWTKSFTIIITGEQLLAEPDNQQAPSVKPANQHRFGAAIDDSNLLNDSGNVVATNTTTNRPANQAPLPGLAAGSKPLIYRHVLTENEVLPNLESISNKPWASRFSHTLNSSLAYRFRIYCSLNYYGEGCTTFCRARDDQFGHYNCSSTGQKVCMDGWHGLDCDKAKCRAGCNQQHGYCEKPDTCTCFDGWAGVRCDECKTHPKCKNGYCLTKNDCFCHIGWGGQLCDQNLNYCGTHEPCKNNGTCQNIPLGGYKCTCAEGYTGVNCDINQNSTQSSGAMTQLSAGCLVSPCLNGGTCFGYESGAPVASAVNGLEVAALVSEDSRAQAGDDRELESERIYRCQCPPGWTGDYCQWPEITFADIITETERSPNITKDNINEGSDQTIGNIPSILSPFIEVTPKSEPIHLDMRRLISGVVIASVVGVLLAALFLAWCCLVAIEHNRFSFIQMNVISNSGSEADEIRSSSRLRRMHEKIRDSFRLSRNRIKPETKLSIENVLRPPRPPPSYEESSNHHDLFRQKPVDYANVNQNISRAEKVHVSSTSTNENLVISKPLEQKVSQSSIVSLREPHEQPKIITDAQLNCPRHGHLYRTRNMECSDARSTPGGEKSTAHSHFTTHLHISSTRPEVSDYTHLGHI